VIGWCLDSLSAFDFRLFSVVHLHFRGYCFPLISYGLAKVTQALNAAAVQTHQLASTVRVAASEQAAGSMPLFQSPMHHPSTLALTLFSHVLEQPRNPQQVEPLIAHAAAQFFARELARLRSDPAASLDAGILRADFEAVNAVLTCAVTPRDARSSDV